MCEAFRFGLGGEEMLKGQIIGLVTDIQDRCEIRTEYNSNFSSLEVLENYGFIHFSIYLFIYLRNIY